MKNQEHFKFTNGVIAYPILFVLIIWIVFWVEIKFGVNFTKHGVFPKTMGKFSGLIAKDQDKDFVKDLDQRKVLVASTPVEHEYAHCWRCHNPVIFKTTTQWFFKVEDLIPKLREINKGIKWVPEWAGANWFDSWLENLRDNSITNDFF